MSNVVTAAALASAIGAAAFVMSTAKISAPARIWLAKQTTGRYVPERPVVKWLYELVSCPFCLSVWLAFAATAIYRPWLVNLWRPVDWLVTSLAIAGWAMLPVWVIKRAVSG